MVYRRLSPTVDTIFYGEWLRDKFSVFPENGPINKKNNYLLIFD